MPIDGCQRKLIELTLNEFPEYLKALQSQTHSPTAMQSLCGDAAVASVLSSLGRAKDFSGCYVLIDTGKPIYVGISRNVVRRLWQHVTDRTQNGASLAYKMAKRVIDVPGTRAKKMADQSFLLEFQARQDYLRALHFVTVEISNPLELYLFEAFCAMELDTHQWNTFITH